MCRKLDQISVGSMMQRRKGTEWNETGDEEKREIM